MRTVTLKVLKKFYDDKVLRKETEEFITAIDRAKEIQSKLPEHTMIMKISKS